jgi:shikimate kinase
MGFMGTGKTSVGKRLAAALNLEFVDMDGIIEERAGKPISRIFGEEGEPHFRQLERALVRELSARRGLVIACGGGVVLNPDNVRDYSQSGLVVCLTATVEAIYQRTARATHRPLLEQEDRFQRIVDLLEKRRALYAAIPHQIDTNRLTPAQVADAILKLYRGG